jgi:hypothetical protein
MVRLAGLEPAHLSARDFKSLVSTYFTTVALFFKKQSVLYVKQSLLSIEFVSSSTLL